MPHSLSISIRAGTVGKSFKVQAELNPNNWLLRSDDSQITVIIPRAAWPFLCEHDSINLFLNVVRVGAAEPPPSGGIEVPGLILPQKGH